MLRSELIWSKLCWAGWSFGIFSAPWSDEHTQQHRGPVCWKWSLTTWKFLFHKYSLNVSLELGCFWDFSCQETGWLECSWKVNPKGTMSTGKMSSWVGEPERMSSIHSALISSGSCFLLTTQINNPALHPCAFSGIMSRSGMRCGGVQGNSQMVHDLLIQGVENSLEI